MHKHKATTISKPSYKSTQSIHFIKSPEFITKSWKRITNVEMISMDGMWPALVPRLSGTQLSYTTRDLLSLLTLITLTGFTVRASLTHSLVLCLLYHCL